jgi:ribosomal protein S18 acetylase RimI-like enzyme
MTSMSMFVRKYQGTTIRAMTVQDIEEVREVGQIAWSDLAMHDVGRRFRYPKRSEKIIEAYLVTDPNGCIVAEADGRIVGSAFCHVWGKVGWTGPLEVLPTYQDHGIGRQLLKACESRLVERGCAVIGLETMCHLPKNLHFYLSSGYRLEQTTVILEKMLRPAVVNSDGVLEITMDNFEHGLAAVSKLSNRINDDLDYSAEVGSIIRRGLGNVFLMERGEDILGCALLHTYQRGEEASFSSIKALLVEPSVDDPLPALSQLLARCEEVSLRQGKTKMLTRFVAGDLRVYNAMMARGYVLKGANVRMVKLGEYTERGWCNITSWAG